MVSAANLHLAQFKEAFADAGYLDYRLNFDSCGRSRTQESDTEQKLRCVLVVSSCCLDLKEERPCTIWLHVTSLLPIGVYWCGHSSIAATVSMVDIQWNTNQLLEGLVESIWPARLAEFRCLYSSSDLS
jgi:hypothetical protein